MALNNLLIKQVQKCTMEAIVIIPCWHSGIILVCDSMKVMLHTQAQILQDKHPILKYQTR